MKKRKRWYVGLKHDAAGTREAFQSEEEPTEASHGQLYGYVTGAFRTKRAAFWACQYGAHWSTIAEAERAAKAEAIIGQVR